MLERTLFQLKTLNTFQVEATAARYVRFDAPEEIAARLKGPPSDRQPRLVLGGGSNVLFLGDVDGAVWHPAFTGIDVVAADRRHIWLRAMAGEVWDDLVAYAVANGWGGIENLSFIPGSVGASAVQNIGAYGMAVKDTIDRVEAVSRKSGEPLVISCEDCGFAYRFSKFKGRWADRFVITAVVFRLDRQPRLVLDYPGVDSAVAQLGAVTLDNVRRAIIAIRQAKLPDPADLGNAGSFFKNPIVGEDRFRRLQRRHPDLPHFAQANGRFKLAAGWLVERCGWKGRRMGRAAVHDRHALVIVNRGGATGREIFQLSERIRQSVRERFGIGLEREVLLVP
jgi:UDP-N-acetylmuramate dehydrogenase